MCSCPFPYGHPASNRRPAFTTRNFSAAAMAPKNDMAAENLDCVHRLLLFSGAAFHFVDNLAGLQFR